MVNKIKKTKKTQYQYYNDINLFPSKSDFEDFSNVNKYLKFKSNLYERHLNIPVSFLQQKGVLDLGCGTGDTALLFAKLGAKLTLVDADDRVWESLRSNFKMHNLQETNYEISHSTAEDYTTKKKFFFIMAEGYLFTCENRNNILIKLVHFLEPGGLLSISFPDIIGSFMEFLKKASFLKALTLENIQDPLSSEALHIAKKIHGDSFAKLPNARPFKTWVHDCIASPFLHIDYCWSAEQILTILQDEDVHYYSSSPSIHEISNLAWYKNIIPNDNWNKDAKLNYKSRVANFLFGSEISFSSHKDETTFYSESLNFLQKLSLWFENPYSSFSKPSSGWFDTIQRSDFNKDKITDIICFFTAFDAKDVNQFYSHLDKAGITLNTWGKSYHYLVVKKNN